MASLSTSAYACYPVDRGLSAFVSNNENVVSGSLEVSHGQISKGIWSGVAIISVEDVLKTELPVPLEAGAQLSVFFAVDYKDIDCYAWIPSEDNTYFALEMINNQLVVAQAYNE